jgi:hypothetical protein
MCPPFFIPSTDGLPPSANLGYFGIRQNNVWRAFGKSTWYANSELQTGTSLASDAGSDSGGSSPRMWGNCRLFQLLK